MTTTIHWRKYRDEQPTAMGLYLLRRGVRVVVVQYRPDANTWVEPGSFTVGEGPRLDDLWAPFGDLSKVDAP